MKYTVVIEQPVTEEMRPQLEQLLTERFSLTPEQAQKLASRRAGRLMKPTNRERAGILVSIYQEVGAFVRLEEIDETPASAPAVTAPSAASSEKSAPFESSALGSSGLSGAPTSVITATAAPSLSGSGLAGSGLAGSDIPLGGSGLGGSGLGGSGLGGGDFWSSMSGSGTSNSGTNGSGADVPLGGSLSAAPLVGSSVVSTPATLSDVASTNLDAGWADFSSLSVGAAPAPVPATPTETPDADTVLQSETLSTQAESTPELQLGARTPLASRLTLPVMVPLALLTLLALLTTALGMNNARQQQLASNARAVATTLGQTLSSERKVAAMQLSNLTNSANGPGFVAVQMPDGSTIASGKLSSDADKWLKSNAAGGSWNSGKGQYQVERVGVFESGGARTIKPLSAGGAPSYRVTVGLPAQGSNPLMTLLPLLLGGLVAMGLGYWLAQQAAQRIVEPINRLVQAADAISMGDLRQSVKPEANDEVGDLAQALERMRLSLDAAMERLRRRRARG